MKNFSIKRCLTIFHTRKLNLGLTFLSEFDLTFHVSRFMKYYIVKVPHVLLKEIKLQMNLNKTMSTSPWPCDEVFKKNVNQD